jgi:hypothetical protein
MPPNKQSLYDDLYSYASKPDVTIVIDSDALNAASGQGKRFVYDEEKNELIIDGKSLSQREETDFLKFLIGQQDEGTDILDSEQEDTLNNYEGYSETFNPYTDIINAFTNVIPMKDIYALKMAYFMKIVNEKDENIKEYKAAIRERFGLRGIYISNLCNAGYYEGQFRTSFFKLELSRFKAYYELRVGFELAALFVHNGMTKKSFIATLEEKILLCSKNEIFSFKVHTMGGENIDFVKENLLDTEVDLGMDVDKKIIGESHNHPVYMDVEIVIK